MKITIIIITGFFTVFIEESKVSERNRIFAIKSKVFCKVKSL